MTRSRDFRAVYGNDAGESADTDAAQDAGAEDPG